MKAAKEFNYHVDGNNPTKFNVGSEIPEIAQGYALKNGLCEKSNSTPMNKAKKQNQRQVKNSK